ncbi:MAG: hypothetical protein H0V24_10420, partial [Chloroflexia bacterium]|nr:hypothetical protein [Chloroflexia bacterium]
MSSARIKQEVVVQARAKEVRPQPLESSPIRAGKLSVDLRRETAIVSLVECPLQSVVDDRFIAADGRGVDLLRVSIGEPGIERVDVKGRIEGADILRPNRQRQIVVERVQEDKVAQDMALDRLQEGRPAALQSLEEVGAREAHQPL